MDDEPVVTFPPMLLNPADRHDYDILTALRGPDLHYRHRFQGDEVSIDTIVKRQSTSILRYFVGVVDGGFVDTPEQATERWNALDTLQKNEARKYWSHNFHFRSHTRAAFEALRQKFARTPDERERARIVDDAFRAMQDRLDAPLEAKGVL